jgi:hypothetical protein
MTLDDLLRYESAAIAAQNVKNEPDLSLIAMQNFYESVNKALEKSGYNNDPIISGSIKKEFEEAYVGIQAGTGISSAGIVKAISTYTGKYQNAFASTKISDLTKYLTEGFDISAEAKSALGKYNESTLADLAKRSKEFSKEEKEEVDKLKQTIEMLKERRFKAKTLGIYNSFIKQNLEGLYPKEEKAEE